MMTLAILSVLVAVPQAGSALEEHAPIVITGIDGFTAENGVTGGDGTVESPYLIEGWVIEGGSDICINISLNEDSAMVYVEISNVELETTSVAYTIDVYSMWLAANMRIADSTVIGGARLEGCPGVTITNCTMTGNMDISCCGIVGDGSREVLVNDTSVSEGSVLISASSNVTVRDTIIDGSLDILGSTNCTLRGNTISDDLSLTGWHDVDYYSTHSISEDNIVAGNPVHYLANIDGLQMTQEMTGGELIVANCSSVTASLLQFSDSTDVMMAFVDHATISGCAQSIRKPIEFIQSNNLTITSCSFTADDGDMDQLSFFHAQDVSIQFCTFENANDAVDADYIENLTFAGNAISNSKSGLRLERSSVISIYSNDIRVSLYDSIRIVDSSDIQVYHNTLNINQVSVEGSEDISWDMGYPIGGNHWYDQTCIDAFTGPDQDIIGSDGIGDSGFDTVMIQDRYPLVQSQMYLHPRAAFYINTSDDSSNISVDASSLWDYEDEPTDLMVRWDWDGDGEWDTEWSTDKTSSWTYAKNGNYTVRIEVLNSLGYSTIAERYFVVEGDENGAFAYILLAVAAIAAICIVAYAAIRYTKGRNDGESP